MRDFYDYYDLFELQEVLQLEDILEEYTREWEQYSNSTSINSTLAHSRYYFWLALAKQALKASRSWDEYITEKDTPNLHKILSCLQLSGQV
tara:strand:+ start:861 stop:1133 length:273 start_codon:yes stop_codon:yes gene_type:complete